MKYALLPPRISSTVHLFSRKNTPTPAPHREACCVQWPSLAPPDGFAAPDGGPAASSAPVTRHRAGASTGWVPLRAHARPASIEQSSVYASGSCTSEGTDV